MADAIAQHGHDRQWSREALLEDVLLREREKFWRPAAAASGLDPQHIEKEERALAVATMTGGLPSDALADDSAGLLPRWDRDQHPTLFNVMSGFVDRTIRPIEPDLVGEFFVLKLLDADREAARLLVQRAWDTAPFGVAPFVDRCAEDFDDHPAVALCSDVALHGSDARLAWGILVANRIAKGDPAAQPLYNELRALAADHPDEADLRAEQARAAFNLIHCLGTGDPAALVTYDELRALAVDHPDEANLRLMQAHAAFNLIHYLGPADLAWARSLYDELRALAANHLAEADLRLRQAWAASNMSTRLRGAIRWGRGRCMTTCGHWRSTTPEKQICAPN